MVPGVTGVLPAGAPAVAKPVPVQPVAFVLLQVRSLVPPSAIVAGVATSEPVTGPITVIVRSAGALVPPPAPSQVTE